MVVACDHRKVEGREVTVVASVEGMSTVSDITRPSGIFIHIWKTQTGRILSPAVHTDRASIRDGS